MEACCITVVQTAAVTGLRQGSVLDVLRPQAQPPAQASRMFL